MIPLVHQCPVGNSRNSDRFKHSFVMVVLENIFTARKRSLGQGNIFTPVCHSIHRGGMRGCSGGGHAWFYLGGCVVLFGGMCGFIWGGMCGFIQGACVVFFGGHAWFYSGGMHGFIQGACVVLFGGHVWFYLGERAWFFQFFRIQ